MEYENFVFYSSFRQTYDTLPEELKLPFLEAIIYYGTNKEMPDAQKDPIIFSLMQLIIPVIDKQKAEYERKSHGGRPTSYNHSEMEELFTAGVSNKEIEKITGASHSTVERYKQVWRSKQLEDDTNTKTEKEKEKESEVMRL